MAATGKDSDKDKTSDTVKCRHMYGNGHKGTDTTDSKATCRPKIYNLKESFNCVVLFITRRSGVESGSFLK